jgi:hypothetical protein
MGDSYEDRVRKMRKDLERQAEAAGYEKKEGC